MRLGPAFETRPNALNAIRLGLATTVIVWHAYALTRHHYLPGPVVQLLSELPVDGFFAISGFLICRAWHRNPRLGQYAAARARRILPGLWVCLLVTAFVIVPAVVALAGSGSYTPSDQGRFVLLNASTWQFTDVLGTPPNGVLWNSWNGSLWSIGWEALCYVAVAALGVAGLLRSRVLIGLAASFWVLSLAVMVAEVTPSDAEVIRLPRIGIMFLAGALLWAHRDRIPLDRRLAGAAVVVVAAGAFVPDYRVIAAGAVAYLMLWLGVSLGRYRRLVLANDLSYGTYVYAFPIQQSLLALGVTAAWLPFAAASIASTLPAAAASWFLVEKPILRRRQVTPATRSRNSALNPPLVAVPHEETANPT